MKTEPLVILEDSREQTPLDFAPFESNGVQVERRALRTGDYSLKGYERQIFIERKSLHDLVGTLTHGRDRFTREIYDRAAFYPVKHLVIEANWREIATEYPFSAANPRSIVNSLYALMMPPASVNIFCSGDRKEVAWYIVKVLSAFKRRMAHSVSGMWKSVFLDDGSDLGPFLAP